MLTQPTTANAVLVNSSNGGPMAALKRRTDLHLRVLTEPKHAALYDSSTQLCLVDDIDDLPAMRALCARLAEKRKIDAVFGASERSQMIAAYLRATLGLPGTSQEIVRGFTDKYVMKRRLAAAHLPVARHASVEKIDDIPAAAELLGWPVVVKPRTGAGCVGVHVVRDTAEIRHLAAIGALPNGPKIIEQYLEPDAEYHCDAIIHGGRIRFCAISQYLEPLLGSIHRVNGSFTILDRDPYHHAIAELHARTVGALGLTSGITHMELLRSHGQLLVSEIACRPGGGGIPGHLKLQYGVDIWDAYVAIALHEVPQFHPQPSDGIAINLQLPQRPGRVVSITEPVELERLPNVVSVVMNTRPGDLIGPVIHSSSHSGVVYARVASQADVSNCVESVERVFELRVDSMTGEKT